MLRTFVGCSSIALLPCCAGCRREPETPPFTPGLGEIMTLTQMRHAKLWFAGEAANWPLSAYELDELQEGMRDAATFHPTHKDAPLPVPALIEKIMKDPVDQLEKAIAARDGTDFTQRFDALTEACNACHRATNFGFNVVTRPSTNVYTNQSFRLPQ
jgi:hypothetical protein